MTEVEQPPQNGIDLSAADDDDNSKARPADIEQDMREMERRKRVEAIMGSKLFREELERIVDSAREGGASGILQQLSDIVGVPVTRVGNVFKTSNCMVPINDIRGVESMGYAKGEKILRCKLAATFRLLDLYGWIQGLGAQITARLKVDQEYFLVNPYGLLYHELTASSLNKVDMQGQIVEQGTTNFGVNRSHFLLHSVVHAARPDIRCAIYIGCSPVVAISSLKTGLLPLTKDACVLGEVTSYAYTGTLDEEERNKLVRNLGPNSKIILLANHGALCCGETIEEAFFAVCHIVQACETQLKLLPVGLDNLVLIPEESRKIIYDQSRRPPEDLEKKFAAALATTEAAAAETAAKDGDAAVAAAPKSAQTPKWRVGGAEFEALMRMLDNAGYRTGYIYRHALVKSEPPRPKNDVELPPAVSSLGYLLEEEELFKQGIWKKGDLRKGGDRSRWLNSPNVYQKVEVLETGTPDPKKITKWVAEGSPTHSTPVRIEDPLQFVPVNTNPKEFKRLQQQIKDNRRADKISAGPQSHILEGVTWDEANRIKDATVSQSGDHVVLMGAASKGIIQRGFQHNATVYKAPYAKNPFDNVTDDELNEYKRTVERKKKSIHGEYTDTDFSESEALSSLQTSGAQQTKQTTTTTTAAVSQSEPETSEHQVLRIETQQAPVPSQAEVVLSDATLSFINGERSHTATNRKPPTGRAQQHALNTLIKEQDSLLKMYKTHLKTKQLAKKYAFLFEPQYFNNAKISSNSTHFQYLHLYMIQKIEIYPNYTYPFTTNTSTRNDNNNNNTTHIDSGLERSDSSNLSLTTRTAAADTNTLQTVATPYRTVSHYGFNYPLTYLPTIKMHPANLLTAVELQRQKVIAFINSTALSYAKRRTPAPLPLNAQTTVGNNVAKLNIPHDQEKVLNVQKEHAGDSDTTNNSKITDSFISSKEIYLESNDTRRRRRNQRISSSSAASTNIKTEELNGGNVGDELNIAHQRVKDGTASLPQADLSMLSRQFSSSLSISGHTYPSHSTPRSVVGEEEEEHEHVNDFCDNSPSHHVDTDNLYRSYVLRNFLPINRTPTFEHDMPQHQPEAEQAFLGENQESTAHRGAGHYQHPHHHNDCPSTSSACGTQSAEAYTNGKHIKLEVNTLKRRPSSTHERHISATYSEEATCFSLNDESTTSLPQSIEIHINIAIKNSDCAKTLQIHEHEFRTKLERVIDEEIHLISQQLGVVQQQVINAQENLQCEEEDLSVKQSNEQKRSAANKQQRCNSAPNLHERSSHINNNTELNYEHNLVLLAHELENLLNSIIRSNELHNRAFICECKTIISQMTADIRNTLNGKGIDATVAAAHDN